MTSQNAVLDAARESFKKKPEAGGHSEDVQVMREHLAAMLQQLADLEEDMLANLSLLKRLFRASGRLKTIGGAATEDFVMGVSAKDNPIVFMHTPGSTPVTVENAECTAGKLTVTFSGDPSDDHYITYVILGG